MTPELMAILALGALVALLGVVLLALLLRRGQSAGVLEARLAQLADSQAAAQARMADSLHAQERALSKAVEERLGDFSKKVSDRLQETSKESQTTLTDLRERLAVIDSAQKTITELSTQVVGLQDILANKQARGAFGEIQLQDLVGSVLPPDAYSFQSTLSNGTRVDCLLTLAKPPGPIAIDAKFPLESYEALRAAKDEAAETGARRALAADLKRHVQAIAEKYILPGETAESALLFLPSEAIYAELHASFRSVVEESFRRRVWIVSPTTLWALLTTIRAVMKDVRMRDQAHLIQAEVQKLLEDVTRLDDRAGRLQRHFAQAEEDIRQIRVSTEKVVKRGEAIEQVEMENTEAVETAVKPPAVQGRLKSV
ncbi:MAG: DNA recombination protein RmuC [Kiloniellales bacterium]